KYWSWYTAAQVPISSKAMRVYLANRGSAEVLGKDLFAFGNLLHSFLFANRLTYYHYILVCLVPLCTRLRLYLMTANTPRPQERLTYRGYGVRNYDQNLVRVAIARASYLVIKRP